jgi:PAS domain S-box-containing protein
MYQPDLVSVGILLTALGLIIWLAVRLLAKSLPQIQPVEAVSTTPEKENTQNEAVLVVGPGGHLISINQNARALFKLQPSETPDLERIVRRMRPADTFLHLCSYEGQAELSLDGRLVELTSYQLNLPELAFMLSLRFPDLAVKLTSEDESGLSARTLKIFAELTKAMASNLDLEATVEAILHNTEKLIQADFVELNILDVENQVFRPYRLLGAPGSERQLQAGADFYKNNEGVTGYLARERRSIFIADIDKFEEVRPVFDRRKMPLRSLIGAPLIAGSELIGTLELASIATESFQIGDLDVLNLIAGQAAIALHNALIYEAELHRSMELVGLAQVAQSFAEVRDQKGLFSKLLESIVPLFNVQILGFLLYNESKRQLEGQVPFHGVPEDFIELYKVPVLPDSVIEQTLLNQDVIIIEGGPEDQQWVNLGFERLSNSAGLSDSVFAPLTASGHMLGYLQASNHIDGRFSFTKEEIDLLVIIANQAAPIIENANLVQQARLRVQRSEALRRIASLASSAATLDEFLKYSLNELVHLLEANMGAVFLVDESQQILRLHRSSFHGTIGELPERSFILSLDDPQYAFTMSGTNHSLLTGQMAAEKALVPFYQQIMRAWNVVSAVVVPLIVRDKGIGELWIGSEATVAFDQSGLQLVATAAGQMAAVVERSLLERQTDESLRRRVELQGSLIRITRELSSSLNLTQLLRMVFDEALRVTNSECGNIRIFDISNTLDVEPKTRFFVGDGSSNTFGPIEKTVYQTGEALYIGDFSNSEFPRPHDGVESTLFVPINYNRRLAGVISLHSRVPNSYDDTNILEVVNWLALQLSVALRNALSYEEQAKYNARVKRELETLVRLAQLNQTIRADQPLNERLQMVANAIPEATPFKTVLISVVDPEKKVLRRVCQVGIPPLQWDELRLRTPSWLGIQQILTSEFQVGKVYFIPADKLPVVPPEIHTVTILPSIEKVEYNMWDPDDMLLAPLFGSDGEPLGLISVDDPINKLRPDLPAFEALELFASQTSMVIEHFYRLQNLQQRVNEMEKSSERLTQAQEYISQTLPLMLRKDLEQTTTIQSLMRQLDRMDAGFEIQEKVSHQPDIKAALQTVARGLLSRFDMQVALIGEFNNGTVKLIETVGQVPQGAALDALFGQRNPLRQAVQENRLLLAASLDSESEWYNTPLLNTLWAKSFVCLPFLLNKESVYGVMVVGNRPAPAFTERDIQTYYQLSQQISVYLRYLGELSEAHMHLQEMNLLLDFSRRLGVLDPAHILQVLMDTLMRIIPAAQTCWVGLWDARENVLLPNAAQGYVLNSAMLEVRFERDVQGRQHMPLPLRVFNSGEASRVEEIHFAVDYNLGPEDLLRFRRAMGGKLPVSSLLVPVRRGDNILGVVVLDNYDQPAAFTDEDEAETLSLAQQTALALESAGLFGAVQQRAAQLQALTQVAGMITSSLNRVDLIASLLEQLKAVVAYETATLWLRSGKEVIIVAANGFDDNEQRLNLKVAIEDSRLFMEMLNNGQPIAVLDIRDDDRFMALMEHLNLSWLGLPLIAKSELIGVIALEKLESGFYTPERVQAATTFASQAAIALENARLFEESVGRAQELDQRSQRLGLLNRFSGELGGSLDVDFIVNLTIQQMQSLMSGGCVAAVMASEKGNYILTQESPDFPGTHLPIKLPPLGLLDHLWDTLGVFNTHNVSAEAELQPLMENYFALRQITSLLIIPLLTGTSLHGWIWLQDTNVHHFSSSEVELLTTIANQSAIAIQNALLFADKRRLTEDLERRVEARTNELRREHRNTQTLLKVITELSTSLDLNMVLNRTLDVMNETLGCQRSAVVLTSDARVYQAGMAASASLSGSNTQNLEKQIARWVSKNQVSTLAEQLYEDKRWNIPEDLSPRYYSMLAVPIKMGEDVPGALIMFHSSADFFSQDQIGLVEAAARQIGISLSNADLFTLIRDQSEHMGAMLREQEIAASRSRGILEAVADGVVVTDPSNMITLFNASAERTLQLKAKDVIGQSLENFSGLFGKAAREWFQTIRKWSEDRKSYEPGTTSYSSQIELDDKRVIEVHLAPVFWRNEFLGTVSIFRDISQEVMVDRLKSEFVANVSHELRTPITSIKGYAEIMLMGASGELNSNQARFLGIIKSNTERLNVLVNDLLDISRIESGKATLSIQRVNMRLLAEDVISDVKRRSAEENKPMNFSLEASKDLPSAAGDIERLRQVLGNLVSNGYNYTQANGLIKIQIYQTDKMIQVDVQDNGVGISPKDHHRIFERFYRGEHPFVLATAGTGLGLAISKILVEMHHGRIWFASNGVPGEGSKFSFMVPVYQEENINQVVDKVEKLSE